MLMNHKNNRDNRINALISLSDITFLIPVRFESIHRLENLFMVVDFILAHFDTQIHILEATSYNNNFLDRLLPQNKNIQVTFVEDYDPVFHRTKYINLLTQNCKTPYLAVWDTDVIVPPEQIMKSVKFLRSKEAEFVYPYKDKFLDVSPIIRELYFKTRNIQLLRDNTGKMNELYQPNPVGGCFLSDRLAYTKAGMENENFYGWGREDGDRINRWRIFDYNIKRISGPLYHLSHDRGVNSNFHADEQQNIKFSEILRISAMSKDELQNEIKTWKH